MTPANIDPIAESEKYSWTPGEKGINLPKSSGCLAPDASRLFGLVVLRAWRGYIADMWPKWESMLEAAPGAHEPTDASREYFETVAEDRDGGLRQLDVALRIADITALAEVVATLRPFLGSMQAAAAQCEQALEDRCRPTIRKRSP